MLPGTLRRTFSPEVAAVFGVGLKTLWRLRAAGLAVRVGTDFRLVEPVDPHRLALVAAGPDASLCTVSAAAAHGWTLLREPAAVHVRIPPGRRATPWPGTIVHRWKVAQTDITELEGLAVTVGTRTALDVALTHPLDEVLVTLDSVLRDGQLTEGQLADAAQQQERRPDYLRIASALRLASGQRASPPESVFRAQLHLAGLPDPVEQWPVVLEGRKVARGDFAWPERRLLVEIDGFAYHSASGDFARDRRRQNAVVLGGWRVLRFTANDVLQRPLEVIAEVRRALSA